MLIIFSIMMNNDESEKISINDMFNVDDLPNIYSQTEVNSEAETKGNEKQEQELELEPEKDMNDKEMISNFLNYCYTNIEIPMPPRDANVSDVYIDDIVNTMFNKITTDDVQNEEDMNTFSNIYKSIGDVIKNCKNTGNMSVNGLIENIYGMKDNIQPAMNNFNNIDVHDYMNIVKKSFMNTFPDNPYLDDAKFDGLIDVITGMMNKNNNNNDDTLDELSPSLLDYFCKTYAKDNNIVIDGTNVHNSYIENVTMYGIDKFSPYEDNELFDNWANTIKLYEFIWEHLSVIEESINNTNDSIEILI